MNAEAVNQLGLPEVPIISPEDLEQVKDAEGSPALLGNGACGAVRLMRMKSTQRLCAVKTQYKHINTKAAGENFVSEVRVLTALQGLKSVPEFFGVTSLQHGGPFPAIVQEFIGGSSRRSHRTTTLYDAIDSGRVTKAQSLHVAVDICRAVRDMHSRQWLHCDLNSGNILLQPSNDNAGQDDLRNDVNGIGSRHSSEGLDPVYSNNITVKLIDFGKTRNTNDQGKFLVFSEERQAEALKYSFHVAPEVIRGQRAFGKASEMFSTGRVLKDLSFVGENFLSYLGDLCMAHHPDHRPSIDDVIELLEIRIQRMYR